MDNTPEQRDMDGFVIPTPSHQNSSSRPSSASSYSSLSSYASSFSHPPYTPSNAVPVSPASWLANEMLGLHTQTPKSSPSFVVTAPMSTRSSKRVITSSPFSPEPTPEDQLSDRSKLPRRHSHPPKPSPPMYTMANAANASSFSPTLQPFPSSQAASGSPTLSTVPLPAQQRLGLLLNRPPMLTLPPSHEELVEEGIDPDIVPEGAAHPSIRGVHRIPAISLVSISPTSSDGNAASPSASSIISPSNQSESEADGSNNSGMDDISPTFPEISAMPSSSSSSSSSMLHHRASQPSHPFLDLSSPSMSYPSLVYSSSPFAHSPSVLLAQQYQYQQQQPHYQHQPVLTPGRPPALSLYTPTSTRSAASSALLTPQTPLSSSYSTTPGSTSSNSSSGSGTPGSRRRVRTSNRWTAEEDAKLTEAVGKHGCKNWKKIAEEVGNTWTPDQCNQHWHRVLNPQIHKGDWSVQEDDLLFAKVAEMGESSWTKIAESLPSRTDIQCRQRYFQRRKEIESGSVKNRSSLGPDAGSSLQTPSSAAAAAASFPSTPNRTPDDGAFFASPAPVVRLMRNRPPEIDPSASPSTPAHLGGGVSSAHHGPLLSSSSSSYSSSVYSHSPYPSPYMATPPFMSSSSAAALKGRIEARSHRLSLASKPKEEEEAAASAGSDTDSDSEVSIRTRALRSSLKASGLSSMAPAEVEASRSSLTQVLKTTPETLEEAFWVLQSAQNIHNMETAHRQQQQLQLGIMPPAGSRFVEEQDLSIYYSSPPAAHAFIAPVPVSMPPSLPDVATASHIALALSSVLGQTLAQQQQPGGIAHGSPAAAAQFDERITAALAQALSMDLSTLPPLVMDELVKAAAAAAAAASASASQLQSQNQSSSSQSSMNELNQ